MISDPESIVEAEEDFEFLEQLLQAIFFFLNDSGLILILEYTQYQRFSL